MGRGRGLSDLVVGRLHPPMCQRELSVYKKHNSFLVDILYTD